jgi:hypothetical protein
MSKGNTSYKKSTKQELATRVGEILLLLANGYTRSYIMQYSSKWNICDRQVDDYIAMANKELKEINALTVQDNLAIITHNLWDVFREARKANNLAEQHKVLVSIAKLKGLEQHTVNHIIEDKRELSGITDAELDNMLQQADLTDDFN